MLQLRNHRFHNFATLPRGRYLQRVLRQEMVVLMVVALLVTGFMLGLLLVLARSVM